MSDLAWMSEAACRDHPEPSIFFLGPGQTGAEAKQVCAGCPVRRECGRFGMGLNVNANGIYGGMTSKERRRLRRTPGERSFGEARMAGNEVVPATVCAAPGPRPTAPRRRRHG